MGCCVSVDAVEELADIPVEEAPLRTVGKPLLLLLSGRYRRDTYRIGEARCYGLSVATLRGEESALSGSLLSVFRESLWSSGTESVIVIP